jgi:hypothetical protein
MAWRLQSVANRLFVFLALWFNSFHRMVCVIAKAELVNWLISLIKLEACDNVLCFFVQNCQFGWEDSGHPLPRVLLHQRDLRSWVWSDFADATTNKTSALYFVFFSRQMWIPWILWQLFAWKFSSMHSDEQGWSEQKWISTDFQKMLSEEVFEEYELCNMWYEF